VDSYRNVISGGGGTTAQWGRYASVHKGKSRGRKSEVMSTYGLPPANREGRKKREGVTFWTGKEKDQSRNPDRVKVKLKHNPLLPE